MPRTEAGREAWDELAEESDDAWLWHVDVFAGALATWDGATDMSFALRDAGGRLLATMPLTAYASSRARGALKFAHVRSLGGPAVAPWVEGRRRAAVRRAAVDAALARAKSVRGVELDVVLPPLAPAGRGENCPRVNPLLELGFGNSLGQTAVIDLRSGADELARRLRDRARAEIKKAEQAGVTVRESMGREDVDRYYALHLENYRRTGARPHPRPYFDCIFSELVPARRTRVLFAEIGGEAIAARSFATFKQAALYWTGAASQRGLQTGAGALIHWHAIETFQADGYEWFDSGEVFPGARDGKSRGLTLHKTSFGGEIYPLYRGAISIHRREYELVESLRRLRGSLRG